MSKHAIGPWFIGKTIVGGHRCIIEDGDSVVALLPDETTGCTYNPYKSRLIAAAPELLEACETLLFELVAGPASRDEVIANARAAIAKATGEQA